MICHASYNFCATCIVLATEKPSLREASCCSVDVVNGAEGVFFHGLTSILEILNVESFISFRNFSVSLGSFISFQSSALNCFFSFQIKSQITLKNDSD